MQVKTCHARAQILKNMRFVILFDMLLNPVFKVRTYFGNVIRTTARTSRFIY